MIYKCLFGELKKLKNVIILFSLYLISLYLFVLYNGGDSWYKELTRFYTLYHIFATFVFLALLIIQTKKQFSIRYKKEMLEKYKNVLSHNDSLSLETSKLYWVNNLVLLCTVFLPYIIFSLLSNVVVALYRSNFGDELYFCRTEYFAIFIITVIFTILFYNVLVFLVTSSKKFLMEVVLPVFILVAVLILFNTTSYLYSEFVNFGLEYSGINFDNYYNYGFLIVVLSLIISAFLFICSYRNYISNQEVSCESTVNVLWEKILISIVITIFSILMYIAFGSFKDYWIVQLGIINTVVCFIIINILGLKQNWLLYILSLALSVVYFSVILFDVFEVGNSAPPVSELREIEVEHISLSTELYSEVRDLQEILWSDEFSDTEQELYITTESMIDIIQIEYIKNNGTLVTRYYNVDNPEFYEKFKAIVEREENKDFVVDKVKANKGNEVAGERFLVKYTLYGEDSTAYFNVYEDSKEADDDLDYVVNTDFAVKDEIVDCLLLDINNDNYFTSFDETHVIVGSIRFVSRNSEMVEVPIKGSYTNTLEYFSKYLVEDNVLKTFEDSYIVVATTLEEDVSLTEAIRNNEDYFEIDALKVAYIGSDLFNKQSRYYLMGKFELKVDDVSQEEIIERFMLSQDLVIKDIISYNDESETYLDYINNKVVYYNVKGIIPVDKEKELYYVYEVSKPSSPHFADDTSVKFLGAYYE